MEAALSLFSQRGYSAVPIRDICGLVGVKESTLYYHFSNKKDLFLTLQARFSQIVEGFFAKLRGALQKPLSQLDDRFFEKVGEIHIEGFLMDDFCNRFLRLLYMEQFGNAEARALYESYMFEMPLRFQSGVFAALMKMGVLPQGDSQYLAVRYYAPIFLYTQMYLLSGDLTEEKKAAFRKAASAHIRAFIQAPDLEDQA